MSKFVTTTYGNKKEILKIPDTYVALPGIIDISEVEFNEEGKKIIPAGTPVGGSMLGSSTPFKIANDATAQGLLLNDLDATHGNTNAAVLIFGFVDYEKIAANGVTLTAEAIGALKGITFINSPINGEGSGGGETYTLPAATKDALGGVKQAATQANSAATDVAGMVTDFNALLAKLKAAGIMA